VKDLYHDYKVTSVILPVGSNNATAGNGTGTDLLGYEGCLMVATIGAVGAKVDTSNTVTINFLESANNIVFTAIADTDLVGGNNTVLLDANGDCNSTHQRGYIGSKRYVTISFTYAGTHGAVTPIQAQVIKGFPIHAPIVI
jgi:hypothetical protein